MYFTTRICCAQQKTRAAKKFVLFAFVVEYSRHLNYYIVLVFLSFLYIPSPRHTM